MKTEPDALAYPYAIPENWVEEHSGFTKREEFAARAMQGLLANEGRVNDTVLTEAVLAADCLIYQLNRKKEK